MPRPKKNANKIKNTGVDLHANSLESLDTAKKALEKAKKIEDDINNKYLIVPVYYPDKKMTVFKKTYKIFEDD